MDKKRVVKIVLLVDNAVLVIISLILFILSIIYVRNASFVWIMTVLSAVLLSVCIFGIFCQCCGADTPVHSKIFVLYYSAILLFLFLACVLTVALFYAPVILYAGLFSLIFFSIGLRIGNTERI
jgi:hypothetical protein